MTHGQLLPARIVHSRHLESRKTVRIYLPPSYGAKPAKRFPVLYVHGGQNIFSSSGPDACFGWGSWELDLTADKLAAAQKMREIIIVAIDNGRYRYQEYRGRAAYSEPTRFHQYANFIGKELKARIDSEFRTLPSPGYTG